MDSVPSNSHGNLDEQISQLMQCKPLSEQEVISFPLTASFCCTISPFIVFFPFWNVTYGSGKPCYFFYRIFYFSWNRFSRIDLLLAVAKIVFRLSFVISGLFSKRKWRLKCAFILISRQIWGIRSSDCSFLFCFGCVFTVSCRFGREGLLLSELSQFICHD